MELIQIMASMKRFQVQWDKFRSRNGKFIKTIDEVKGHFENYRDVMPDPRRSIEIELQWLVSIYSPKILTEIQIMLNVGLIMKYFFEY